jgi:sugar/nucleoside kinase (ribokinase family)
MSLLVVGSVALDSIKTPHGDHKDILGGSATHASMSASFHTNVNLVGVVGNDFPVEHIDYLNSRKIDTMGLEIANGKTFRWEGFYEGDMSQANTIDTQLNVFADFDPKIPDSYKQTPYVFLGNIHPLLQNKVLDMIPEPKLVGLDTMNLWIDIEKDNLTKVLKRIDVLFINDAEIRQYTGEVNLITAAEKVLDLGVKYVLLKKGEHGALLISKDTFFAAPAYPVKSVFDPTGAGDTFAGGFMGYISNTDDMSIENMKKALITGTVMSSFNVEEFSLNRLKKLKDNEIVSRYEEMKTITTF